MTEKQLADLLVLKTNVANVYQYMLKNKASNTLKVKNHGV
ncbi:Uncharacterised protein [Actinobacillus equuli]|nr:Uncharacterised protein [Actinobacillus equuli]